MATNTTNYNLEKPEQSDYYNVDVQNRNMDKIDTEMAKTKIVAESAGVLTDATKNSKYKWGIDNGVVYLEEVG